MVSRQSHPFDEARPTPDSSAADQPVDQPVERPAVEVRIEDVAEAQLIDVARLHVEAFPDSVLGRLGIEAVRRNYHWQLTGPHELTALAAMRDGEMLGFLFGGIFRGSTIGFVKKEKWFLLRRVLRHPSILTRGAGWNRVTLAARLVARRASPAQMEVPNDVPQRSFGVLAIAVSPAAQGLGIGHLLMGEASRRAVAADFIAMHLTVHPENDTAVSFYRNQGWTEVLESSGSWSGRMRLELPTASG